MSLCTACWDLPARDFSPKALRNGRTLLSCECDRAGCRACLGRCVAHVDVVRIWSGCCAWTHDHERASPVSVSLSHGTVRPDVARFGGMGRCRVRIDGLGVAVLGSARVTGMGVARASPGWTSLRHLACCRTDVCVLLD